MLPAPRFLLRPIRTVFSALAIGAAVPFAAAQGSLTPPGAPAPTMKSLEQISAQLTSADAKSEARIAIDTLPGDASAKYLISQPGSYYLRGNLTGVGAGQNGIRVSAANVAIDLNGYTLIGAGSGVSTQSAIAASASGTTVRNGRITAWYSGVALNNHSGASDLIITEVANVGVSITGSASVVRHLTVNNAGNVGILAALVEGCTVTNITGGTGHKTGIEATVVRDCTVTTVTANAASQDATGIRARTIHGCRVTTVTADRNAWGISANDFETGIVAECAVSGITGNSSTYGILGGVIANSTVQTVSSGATTYGIAGNTVDLCIVNGISQLESASGSVFGIGANVVRGCRVTAVSTPDQTAYGINAARVDGCSVNGVANGTSTGSGYGINLASQGSAVGNSVINARTAGIRIAGTSIVLHNTISTVGTAAGVTDGAHILISGNDNRIEGNSLAGGSGCDYGIRTTATRNLVIGNRASSTFTGAATGVTGIDTPEFNLSSGNRFGPIATALASGEITSTNPYANYAD